MMVMTVCVPSLTSEYAGPEPVSSLVRLKVEVQGGEEGAGAWCRRTEALLTVHQLPSLAIARQVDLPISHISQYHVRAPPPPRRRRVL